MENAHIVRHVRYSEIDALPELTWEEKQRLRARIRKKKIEPALSLKKLKEGDEREWTVFIEMFKPKVVSYIRALTDDRFFDDIISESIINVFISRHMYNTLDHMIGSLHQFARYESFARGNKRSTRLLLSENIELFMDWDTYIDQHEEENLALRQKREDWKDKMLILIRDAASSLPPQWRAWIFLNLSGKGIKEVWRESKSIGMTQTSRQHLCIRRLKFLIETELYGEKIDQSTQLRMLTEMVSRFHKSHLEIIKSIIVCDNQKDAEALLNLSTGAYRGRIEKMLNKIARVYTSPYLRSPTKIRSRFDTIKSITDEQFWKAINEGIAKNTGKTVSGKGVKVVDSSKARDIILLRDQQKMSWENIGIALHMDYRTAREIYRIANPAAGALNWNKGDDMKIRALTMQQAVEIRKLYKTGNYTQPALAAKYGVARTTIQGIIEGRSYKAPA
jgi:DNA-directed RNA polymerase specialized sigma24 family protein